MSHVKCGPRSKIADVKKRSGAVKVNAEGREGNEE